MPDPTDRVIEILNELRNNSADFSSEVRKLKEIKEWALSQLHVAEGDAVTLREDIPINIASGWWPYREILVKNSTGVVSNLYLYNGHWRGYFTPDVCWSHSDWKGGSRYQSEHGKCFMMRLDWMRRRKPKDKELIMPSDALPRIGRYEYGAKS